jgi:predicted flap endonuclease-1-like 5' DNA nuclease
MVDWIEANWLVSAGIVVAVLLVAWLVFGRSKPVAQREYHDVLSEGAGPAQRNTALIDTPPAAAITPITPPPGAGLMAGVAEIVAHAAEEEVESVAAIPSGDDLTRIKGLGPKISSLLHSLGVTTFAQIASWGAEDIAAIDAKLGAFAGRAVRDNWVEQARLLAGGDTGAYEAKFGKL